MARIPIYQPQESTQAPQLSPRSPEGGMILGRSIAGFGAGLSELGQKLEQNDTLVENTQLTSQAELSKLGFLQKWDDYKQNADPEDPDYHNLATKFMSEVVQPGVDELGKNLKTDGAQQNYQLVRARLLSEVGTSVLHDQTQLTADVVAQNAKTTGDAITAGVYRDPLTSDAAMTRLHDYRMILQSSGLPVAAAEKWEADTRSQIVQSKILGTSSRVSPVEAQKLLDDPQYAGSITPEDREKLQRQIKIDEDANRTEGLRAQAADEKAKKDAAYGAYDKYTTQMLIDPTKVDPKAIATDPALANFGNEKWALQEHLNTALKKQGGDDLEGKHSPGFWKAYQGVTSQGPDRITDPFAIYKRTGPGGDLSLADAKQLTELQKEVQTSLTKGDGDAQASAEFYRYSRSKMFPFGTVTQEDNDAYHDWFQKTRALDAKLKASGMTAGERYGEDGPLAKLVKPPPVTDGTLVDKPAAPPPSFLQRAETAISGFMAGTAAANQARTEPKTTDDVVSAFKAGRITRQKATELLTKMGHPLTKAQ